MSALKIGIGAGAGVAAILLIASTRGAFLDPFGLFIILLAAAAGGCFGGALVLAAVHVRRSPVVLLRALVFVGVLSLLVCIPYAADGLRARSFLARADSAQGVVIPAHSRAPSMSLWVRYVAGDSGHIVSDRKRGTTGHLRVGDSTWVFVDPAAPARATIGRPGPEWSHAFRVLVPLSVIAGVLFLGYGVSAIPPGVPQDWRSRVRVLRAYVGAAAMADLGFVLVNVVQMDLADPREEVVQAFWNSLFLGALFSLIFTLILGGIGLGVLFERRWTSASAYGLSGVVLGAVGSLLFLGPAGVLIGAVSGSLAGIASWWLLFWGGEPFERPVAAA